MAAIVLALAVGGFECRQPGSAVITVDTGCSDGAATGPATEALAAALARGGFATQPPTPGKIQCSNGGIITWTSDVAAPGDNCQRAVKIINDATGASFACKIATVRCAGGVGVGCC